MAWAWGYLQSCHDTFGNLPTLQVLFIGKDKYVKSVIYPHHRAKMGQNSFGTLCNHLYHHNHVNNPCRQ
ncbi:hypothetical protein B0189_06725 [Moraxella cuniculi]|nr:hypothetical protein B0189_06725 [Moraxella cuniculi]